MCLLIKVGYWLDYMPNVRIGIITALKSFIVSLIIGVFLYLIGVINEGNNGLTIPLSFHQQVRFVLLTLIVCPFLENLILVLIYEAFSGIVKNKWIVCCIAGIIVNGLHFQLNVIWGVCMVIPCILWALCYSKAKHNSWITGYTTSVLAHSLHNLPVVIILMW